MNWTDEQIDAAKRLSLETSASGIARELSKGLRPGTTRNAVIGMLDRLRNKGETVQLSREAAAGREARKTAREEARKAKEVMRQAAAAKRERERERERARRLGRERSDRVCPGLPTATVHDWDQVFGSAPGGVPFASVALGQCKWPLEGRGPSMRCCGRHASGIYCEAHAATAVDRRAA